MFPTLSEAVARLIPVEQLRWIGFGHVEADECGAMNSWLAAAPRAPGRPRRDGVHGVGQRSRRPGAANAGGRRNRRSRRQAGALRRHAACPARLGSRRPLRGGLGHLAVRGSLHPSRRRPCGDRQGHRGTRDRGRTLFHYTSLGPATAPNVRKLAALKPRTLAVMHGASFNGNGGHALTRWPTTMRRSSMPRSMRRAACSAYTQPLSSRSAICAITSMPARCR